MNVKRYVWGMHSSLSVRTEVVLASDYDRDIGALRTENEELSAEIKRLDDHIIECQETLCKLGVTCGADGNVRIGIDRLAEKHEELKKQLAEAQKQIAMDSETIKRMQDAGYVAEAKLAEAREI